MPGYSWPVLNRWPAGNSSPFSNPQFPQPAFPPSLTPFLWVDANQTTYSDSAGTVPAVPFDGRVRRINFRTPAVGNAQSPTDPTRPWRDTGAINFEVGATTYMNAPVAADQSQQAVTIAVNFTVRDKPEGSPQCLVCNSNRLKIMTFSANIPAVNYNDTAGFWLPDANLKCPIGAQCTFIFRFTATQIRATIIIDGSRYDYSTTVAVNALTLIAANWFLGYDGTSLGDQFLQGTITQALGFVGAISDADNDLLADWCAANRAPRFPSAVPLVVVSGNSIARVSQGLYGVPVASSWAMLAQQGLNGTQPVNLANAAVSGQTIDQQQSTVYPYVIAPLYHPSRSRNVLIVAAGTNDMAAGNQDGPTTLAEYYAYCDQAQAAGWRIVGATILKRIGTGHDAAFETARTYFNTNLLAGYVAKGYLAVADFGAIALMQNPADTAYFSDGIHPTTAGHALMAPVAQAALQTAIT